MSPTECGEELGETSEHLRRWSVTHRQRHELVDDAIDDEPQILSSSCECWKFSWFLSSHSFLPPDVIVGNQQVNGCCRPHPRLKSCSLQRLQLYMFSIQRFFDMKTFSDMKTFFDMKTFSLGRITQDFLRSCLKFHYPICLKFHWPIILPFPRPSRPWHRHAKSQNTSVSIFIWSPKQHI